MILNCLCDTIFFGDTMSRHAALVVFFNNPYILAFRIPSSLTGGVYANCDCPTFEIRSARTDLVVVDGREPVCRHLGAGDAVNLN
jgi:hypothetical protein